MNESLLSQLRPITAEEQAILDGDRRVQRELYTSRREFVVDSQKLLEKGQLIEIRPHTRFIHFPRHRHNYVELVYMCSGTTRHILNDAETVTLEEGDLLFLNQGVYHEILPAGREDIAVNFIILPEFFDRSISMIERENVLRDFLLSTLSGTGTDAHYLHIPAKKLLPVQNLMENMVWTLLHGGSNTNTLNQTTMGLMLLNLSQYAESISRDDPNRQEQNLVFLTLKYIDTHYKSGTLAEVSAQLGCPTYFLSRLLTKHAGGSFKDLLQQRKLQQAAYLLANTPLTVEAILDSIGYRNSSYFYRRFREKYGCSPVEYRNREAEKSFELPQPPRPVLRLYEQNQKGGITMKKYFTWLPALALLLTLTGCGGSIQTSPFPVTVTADSGTSVEAMLGTYTWEYEDGEEWKGMTADSDHPLWCQEWMPALDASGGTVTVSAEVAPDSITVQCWSTDDWCDADYPDGEAVETKGLTFSLREDGDYVYEVTARWNSASKWEGTAYYCFYTAAGG